ncbi:siderophore iron transporter mirb [Stemphylium lycopersici]|uniref:Siderophore iron transporter mirb n=1 Tax=Stemphylium lycopersici TaxID=183478 RepID=A0A364MTE6_STELY|nr:siderophore iron transporter mirb [Stemphylium lycopersici]RAR02863.1 siderophore iron transporter mirb [Stemphylium lycopersici]RAR12298.1 siderophore iron transporter mirb [Stemphylium lycopersici]
MGFNFKGLTSSALVAGNTDSANADHKDISDVPAAVQGHTSMDAARPDEKVGSPRASSMSRDSDEELNGVDASAEQGVQAVQAASLIWKKRDLILAYIFMWFIQFFTAYASSTSSTLAPYVTSSFNQHSLTALTTVISSIVGGIWKLPYAKILNIWGRPFGLSLGVAIYVVGLILMASCNNVKAYCAAQTFFNVGYNSIDFFVTVFIADTSKLKNRALFISYASSPWLITTWVYGYGINGITADGGIGWRWAYGIFAILAPIVISPLVILFVVYEGKARKQGLITPRPSRGNFGQTVYYYLREFDAVGLLVLAAGLSLFLLSFNIYSYQADGWKSPLIICFIVFGAILVALFGLWEKYCAPVTFIPWPLLKNRTVIFTYTMAGSLYIGWYCWDSYFYSLLIVLFNQTEVHATWISNIYTMGSCFICIIYGITLRYYGKLKIYSLFMGVPLTMLGVGLMIKFRQPDENIGYIVMCMIFIAFGGGILVISEQTTLMAVSKQQDFPALLAVESMIISIGSAIGSTIAGAIWTGVFPARLMANLPASAMDNFPNIYGDFNVQASYPVGSPTRDAINLSYGQTQRYMLIAAVCVYCITLFSVALWQNVDVRTMKQRTIGLL